MLVCAGDADRLAARQCMPSRCGRACRQHFRCRESLRERERIKVRRRALACALRLYE